MGVGSIIQKNVASSCETIWKKVPQIPSISVDLTKYNPGFVSLVSLIGAYSLYKSSICLTKKALKLVKPEPKLLPLTQMQQKYGQNSWALIVDCKGNQQYCCLLASRGFHLILCGDEKDIKFAHNSVLRGDHADIQFKNIVINWKQEAKNLKFYDDFVEQLKDYDVSFLVMPVIGNTQINQTYKEEVPVFEHVYLTARYFGPKLKWRSYTSAIIIPSNNKIDQIDDQNGITRAVQSGIDAFGRTLGFEVNGLIEIVIARGRPEKAIANLGKSRVSN